MCAVKLLSRVSSHFVTSSWLSLVEQASGFADHVTRAQQAITMPVAHGTGGCSLPIQNKLLESMICWGFCYLLTRRATRQHSFGDLVSPTSFGIDRFGLPSWEKSGSHTGVHIHTKIMFTSASRPPEPEAKLRSGMGGYCRQKSRVQILVEGTLTRRFRHYLDHRLFLVVQPAPQAALSWW